MSVGVSMIKDKLEQKSASVVTLYRFVARSSTRTMMINE